MDDIAFTEFSVATLKANIYFFWTNNVEVVPKGKELGKYVRNSEDEAASETKLDMTQTVIEAQS